MWLRGGMWVSVSAANQPGTTDIRLAQYSVDGGASWRVSDREPAYTTVNQAAASLQQNADGSLRYFCSDFTAASEDGRKWNQVSAAGGPLYAEDMSVWGGTQEIPPNENSTAWGPIPAGPQPASAYLQLTTQPALDTGEASSLTVYLR